MKRYIYLIFILSFSIELKAQNQIVTFNGVGSNSNQGHNNYGIYQEAGDWTYPYPDLVINYHTGIKMVGYYNYGGIRFYTGYSDGTPTTEAMSIGDGDHNVRVKNNLFVGDKLSFNNANPGAKITFQDVNNGNVLPDGITWFGPSPQTYGIYKTAGTWFSPNYQQLKLSWDTGLVLDPGTLYGKSYVDIQGNGIRVTSGSIGIGTTNTQGYKLAVAGNMIAEEVKVKLQGTWPDYVFNEDYKITPLSEIQTYIKKNKHLPEVPSAKEIQEKGVNLGEMNKLLLKKVEELTLHLIEQEQNHKNLLQNVEKLRTELILLKSK